MADPILSVAKVVREYGERVRTRALAGVDLVLEQGEFAALIGPSGSGKSTLLNIVGLLDRPTSGRVTLAGTDTSGLDARALTALRAHTLGFVFQFHHLLPAFTAVENVMLPAWGDEGLPSREMRARTEELLAAVGLSDRASYKTNDLSGGEQQRVAIARALARRPSLVLADEPTGNLDTASSDEIFELMRRFNREFGTTFLVVTHDPRIADRCNRIIEIVDGLVRVTGYGQADRTELHAAGAGQRLDVVTNEPRSSRLDLATYDLEFAQTSKGIEESIIRWESGFERLRRKRPWNVSCGQRIG